MGNIIHAKHQHASIFAVSMFAATVPAIMTEDTFFCFVCKTSFIERFEYILSLLGWTDSVIDTSTALS